MIAYEHFTKVAFWVTLLLVLQHSPVSLQTDSPLMNVHHNILDDRILPPSSDDYYEFLQFLKSDNGPRVKHGGLYQALPNMENMTECQRDVALIWFHNQLGVDWAQRFLDAAGQRPSGLWGFNIRWLGDFDQCRAIRPVHIDGTDITITPQYCRLSLAIKRAPTRSGQARYNTGGVTYGACLPTTCTDMDEIAIVMEPLLKNIIPLFPLTVNTNTSVCIMEEIPYSPLAIVTIVVFSVIAAILLMALVIDVIVQLRDNFSENVDEPKSTSKLVKFIVALSPYSNFLKLMKVSNNSNSEPNLSAINGIRTLSLYWVILGHAYQGISNLVDNPLASEKVPRRLSAMFVNSGIHAVDSFFLLSGFLAYWSLAKQYQGKSIFQFFKSLPFIYFHRYVRLTPPYAALIVILMALWPHLGTGPYYYQWTDPDCVDNWWTNIIYVNNIVRANDICISWSWYLPVDMQLFILVPFAVYLLVCKKPSLGWILCLIGLTCHIACNLGLTFFYQLPDDGFLGPEKGTHNITDTKRYDLVIRMLYYKPYTRAAPYIIGVIAAHLAMKHAVFLRKHIFSKLALPAVLWLVCFGTMLAITYGKYDFLAGKYYNPTWADALYNAFVTVGWGLALGWVLLACVFNAAGPVGGVLSWPIWGFTARLSYCGYLFHPLVSKYYVMTSRRPFNMTDITFILFFLSFIFATTLISIPLSLTFEAPIVGLQQLFIKAKSKSHQSVVKK